MTVLALIFVFGAWIVQQLPVLPDLAWSATLLPVLLMSYGSRQSQTVTGNIAHQISLVLLFFALGFFWAAAPAHWRLADQLPLEWEQRDVRVVGVVASMPQQQERGARFEFDVEQILTPHARIPRRIALTQYAGGFGQPAGQRQVTPYQAGQRWQLTVRVKRAHGVLNPHGFDYEAWALERNIRATGSVRSQPGNQLLEAMVYRPSYVVEKLRERIRERMQNVLQERPYAGVLRALAIGDDSAISQPDWQVFLRTGINHLVSISGLHITMLATLAFALVYALWRRSERLTLRLPARKAATAAGAVAALLYALIAGFAIPTQRTLYMLSVFGLALWMGRHVAIARVLAYALVVVVILDPWAVLAAGFWLSFGAVAIISYALGGRLRKLHWLREAVATQWAVTLGLVPLLLIMFQQVSIVSPLANALAIPVVSLIVVPITLLGSVLPLDWALLLAHWVMQLCMAAMRWMASSSFSVWQQQAPPFWTLPLAVIGMLWMLLPRGFPLRWMGVIGLLPMFLVQPTRPLYGDMRAVVLDVGQGLSVVVTTQHHALLYDTGPSFSAEENDSGNRIVVPYLRAAGIRHLDRLLISHNDDDHSGGMVSVLEQVPVERSMSSLPEGSPLHQYGHHERCHAGQSWQWDGVTFEMIYPAMANYTQPGIKDNDLSCVLRISSQRGRLLIPGDIEKGAEDALLAAGHALQAEVLIAPHHGSKTSSSLNFLEAVKPAAVVFTAGYLSRYGHPHPSVVQRYQGLGSKAYRSDQDGAIVIDFTAARGIEFTRWRQRERRYWHWDFREDTALSQQKLIAEKRLAR